MGLSATHIEDWEWLSMDPELRYEKEIEAGAIKFYKRLHSRFSRRRKFYGLMSFTEDVGNTATTMTGYVSAASFMSYVSARTWVLTTDRPTVLDQVTGEGIQEQVWETMTDRTLVDPTVVFGGAIP